MTLSQIKEFNNKMQDIKEKVKKLDFKYKNSSLSYDEPMSYSEYIEEMCKLVDEAAEIRDEFEKLK